MVSNPALWARIEAFQFDKPDCAFSFSQRLAVETGWPRAYALAAVEEYRRFVYLASISSAPLTPSREVDAVWHLHLVYTWSYWKEFCGEVLGRELHHGPTPGGERAALTYREQYAETRRLYLDEFGSLAPHDFWPPEAERFQSDLRLMRRGFRPQPVRSAVSTSQRIAAGVGLLALGLAALIGSVPPFGHRLAAADFGTTLIVFLGGLLIFVAAIAFLGSVSQRAKKADNRGGDSSGGYYGGDGGSGGKSSKDANGDGGSDGGGD
ncbi:MAG TPA: hypothetical protein DCL54_00080, partial [Alphaproteobacteria bacterium]|nr:hypothetical protein [Alphaproteobacteria bacterium]